MFLLGLTAEPGGHEMRLCTQTMGILMLWCLSSLAASAGPAGEPCAPHAWMRAPSQFGRAPVAERFMHSTSDATAWRACSLCTAPKAISKTLVLSRQLT